MNVDVFTDGSCWYQTQKGGCAAILRCGVNERELSRGLARTTTNRAELHAVLLALEALKSDSAITLYSDSQYVVKGINEYLPFWRSVNFRKHGLRFPGERNPQMIANYDLWQRLSELLVLHTVKAIWVRGHSGHVENERCDVLAGEAYRNGPWIEDNAPAKKK